MVEVAPRDGLQNANACCSTERKVTFIEALVGAGVTTVEATSFVNPVRVPMLADADDVMRRLRRVSGVRYLVLVPNERGYDRAMDAGVNAIAFFTSATERFCRANLRASIEETFQRFQPIQRRAKSDRLWIRAYISVAFGCPYSGEIDPAQVGSIAARLFDLGCDEIALADTIGAARPGDVERLLDSIQGVIPVDRLALHFHDTAGRALDNVDVALKHGVTTFDGAAGGLGGCPFAPGAPGNLATEKLVDHLHRRGIQTGINSEAIRRAVSILPFQDVQPDQVVS